MADGVKRKERFSEFTLGYLAAAAQAARAGADTLAVEMCREAGVTHSWELDGRGLEMFDKKPLVRVLLLCR